MLNLTLYDGGPPLILSDAQGRPIAKLFATNFRLATRRGVASVRIACDASREIGFDRESVWLSKQADRRAAREALREELAADLEERVDVLRERLGPSYDWRDFADLRHAERDARDVARVDRVLSQMREGRS